MNFQQLTAVAEQVVSAARRRLPAAVRAAADRVPVCYEPHPNAAILAEGWEPDILGLFIGHIHGAGLESGTEQAMPSQILLFLENIWDYAEADLEIYRDEVRLTYLHELGHYLGWGEDEIAERGLE
jgi:predicted Zn-dependent protease with MMP-like domain